MNTDQAKTRQTKRTNTLTRPSEQPVEGVPSEVQRWLYSQLEGGPLSRKDLVGRITREHPAWTEASFGWIERLEACGWIQSTEDTLAIPARLKDMPELF